MIRIPHAIMFDHESHIPMLCNRFNRLTGATEYSVTVSNGHEEILRYICRVEREHPSEPPQQYWCDTATGSLYTDDGRCLSGHLWMIDKPRRTGRKVPNMATRNKEQVARSLSYEYDEA